MEQHAGPRSHRRHRPHRRLGQVLPGGEERQQVCGRQVNNFSTFLLIFTSAAALYSTLLVSKNLTAPPSYSKAYKCAVFFENLTSRRKLTWIGALPDALRKAKDKAEVAEILGAEVTAESFSNFPSCKDSAANARCYATVSLVIGSSANFPLLVSFNIQGICS